MLVVQRVQRVATNVACRASAATIVSICQKSFVKPEAYSHKDFGCHCEVLRLWDEDQSNAGVVAQLIYCSIEQCSVVNSVIGATFVSNCDAFASVCVLPSILVEGEGRMFCCDVIDLQEEF